MKKTGKILLGLTAVGAGIGAAIAYFAMRSDDVDEEEFNDSFEEEDFDLDDDLEPVGQRDYVSLSKQTPVSNETMGSETPASSEEGDEDASASKEETTQEQTKAAE
ncbi:MAG: hypothetical protein PHN80_14715 [Hespellia sp.]|nr:hypothetical protein [Hespellia sp.]